MIIDKLNKLLITIPYCIEDCFYISMSVSDMIKLEHETGNDYIEYDINTNMAITCNTFKNYKIEVNEYESSPSLKI